MQKFNNRIHTWGDHVRVDDEKCIVIEYELRPSGLRYHVIKQNFDKGYEGMWVHENRVKPFWTDKKEQ